MIEFTPSARQRLNEYLVELRLALAECGSVDPGEVERDVQDHIQAALGEAAAPVDVTLLDQVLHTLGAPADWVDEDQVPWFRRLPRERVGDVRLAAMSAAQRLAVGPETALSQTPSGGYRRPLAIGGAVALVAMAIAAVRFRDGFQKIFLDFGVELPRFAGWVVALPSWVIVCLFLAPTSWLLFKDALVRDDTTRGRISIAIAIATVAGLVLLVTSLLLPLVTLVQRLS
jgi:hypothetical protein